MLRKILTWLSSLFWKTNLEEPDDEDIPYRTKAYVEPEKKKKKRRQKRFGQHYQSLQRKLLIILLKIGM